MAFFNELAQQTLTHHRVGEVQTGKFALLRTDRLAATHDQTALFFQTVNDPIIERTVDFEFQSAHRVRHAFERIFNRMGEVIHRITVPGVARVVVGLIDNAVDDRVAEVDVGRSHVNLGAEAVRTFSEFTSAHATEEIEVFFYATIAIGGETAGFLRDATISLPLLLGEFAHIGLTATNQFLGNLPHGVKHIASVEELVPLVTQPGDILLQLLHELISFLRRVRIVHTQVALTIEVARHTKVHPHSLRVANVDPTIGFGRKTGHYGTVILTSSEVFFNPLTQKVTCGIGFSDRSRRGIFFHKSDIPLE